MDSENWLYYQNLPIMPRTRSMTKQLKNGNCGNHPLLNFHASNIWINQEKNHYMNFSVRIPQIKEISQKVEILSAQNIQIKSERREQKGMKESRKKNQCLYGLHSQHPLNHQYAAKQSEIQNLIKNISLGDKQSENALHHLDISYQNNLQIKEEESEYLDYQVQGLQNTEVTAASSTFQEGTQVKQEQQYLKITLEQLKTYQIIKSLAAKIIMKNYGPQVLHGFQKLVSKNMRILFVPQPTNNLGVKLLSSGKFVLAYYFAFLRGESNPMIIDYILKTIEENFDIIEERQYLIGLLKHNNIRKTQYLRKVCSQPLQDQQVQEKIVGRNTLKR